MKTIQCVGDFLLISFDNDSITNTKEYWTDERIKNANPVKLETLNEYTKEYTYDTASEVVEADISTAPFNAGGRWFFTEGVGHDSCGSAQFVSNKRLILTAAHCVQNRDTGEIYNNMYIEVGYKNKKSKQKIYVSHVALKAKWHSEKNLRWDYAFAIANKDIKVSALTHSVENIVGTDVTSFGYPLNYYEGQKMVKTDCEVSDYSSGMISLNGNKMTQGCSGGAWVKKDSSIVVGLNSFTFSNGIGIGGPIFDTEFESLYEYVKTLL